MADRSDGTGGGASREPQLDEAGAGDSEFVDRALRGDPAAFASLYRRHLPGVQRVVATSTYDAAAVADIVQEVFARALEGLPGLRDPARFRPWLLSIARNACIDHGRIRSRDPSGEPLEIDPEEANAGPAELAELAELVDLVRGCMIGLSPRDVTVLSLAGYFGLGPVELGTALGVAPGNAKVILHRARRRLRRAIALRMLVRNRAGCPEVQASLRADDLARALRHIDTCPVCTEAAEEEVSLYSASAAANGRTGRQVGTTPAEVAAEERQAG
jgi:RNA polymerase sigma factor (sigma-70 family)